MIVTCPNCAERYRLSDETLARKGRLRCAVCDHRWVPQAAVEPELPKPRAPVTDADEEAAFLAVQEQMRARWQDAATPVAATVPPPEPSERSIFDPSDDEDEEEATDSPKILRTIIAVIIGAALAIAAAGLWIGQQDLSDLPLVGPALDALEPASPVTIAVAGATTLLPSGHLVLEISGTIANPGKTPAKVPSLSAILSGPQGTALRWTIAAPVVNLPPGQQVAFTSTVTGFPASATSLRVQPER